MHSATLLLTAILVAASLACPGQGLPAEHLVPSLANAGFESCTEEDGLGPCPAGDLPDFWHPYYPEWYPTYRGPEEWTSNDARTGVGALRITDQGSFTGGWAGITSTRVPLVPLLAGQILEASAWVKAESGHSNMRFQLYLQWFDAGGAFLPTQAYANQGPVSEWARVAVRAIVPENAHAVAVLLYSCSPCGLGTWLVDDVNLALVLPDLGVP